MTKQIREDARKLRFVKQAVQSHDRFARTVTLDSDLVSAVEWIAARKPEQVLATCGVFLFSRVCLLAPAGHGAT